MVRLYGNSPYKVVLVHGGPGAIGNLKGFAKELSERFNMGVVEALQSKYTIAELVEELHCQVAENCLEKVTLIGHSWGAWLVGFFAEKYPELTENIVLIGCAPLEDKYISEISNRRLQNLSEENREIFQRLVRNKATDDDMRKLPQVFRKSDNYCLMNSDLHQADIVDSKMQNTIWSEAAKLRSSGEILKIFKNLSCKLYLIQGTLDPHPANGVTTPMQENGVTCETFILEKCGHSPFMEKYAMAEFYSILLQIIK